MNAEAFLHAFGYTRDHDYGVSRNTDRSGLHSEVQADFGNPVVHSKQQGEYF